MINAGSETRSGANKISRYSLLSETRVGYYTATEDIFRDRPPVFLPLCRGVCRDSGLPLGGCGGAAECRADLHKLGGV